MAINHKYDAVPEGAAVFDVERGQLSGIRPLFWQTDTSVSKNSWGYVHNQDYKTAGSIVGDLVDIVSKNGALLLNIGPRPDGTHPRAGAADAARDRPAGWRSTARRSMARGPGRCSARARPRSVEGAFTDTKRSASPAQDIRFTTKGDTLYAIGLGWPDRAWRSSRSARRPR